MPATNPSAGDAAIIAFNTDDDSLVILFPEAVGGGKSGGKFHDNLRTDDANVDDGETLSVTGAMLTATEALTFDGAADVAIQVSPTDPAAPPIAGDFNL